MTDHQQDVGAQSSGDDGVGAAAEETNMDARPMDAAQHRLRARAVLGATVIEQGTRFALWSPKTQSAEVRLFADETKVLRTERLERFGRGYFQSVLPDVRAGALYKFVLNGSEVPDPYARFLPFGVHGPARVEPRRLEKSDFRPPPIERWAIYEMHVGTFTPQGTWRAAIQKLSHLVELGITTVEIMPIAAFAGTRGWGYDGVASLSPFAEYGQPDDVRAFVDAAHARGLAVILDVVFNHFGPAGNYLPSYAYEYFTARHKTSWGDAPNFSESYLRRLCLETVRTWLVDYGFDGLRLDATHAIVDDSPVHVLAELAEYAASLTPKKILIVEDERNEPSLIHDDGLDALWADDFHHVVHAILTGERDGYYESYEPTAESLCRVINRKWLYEGQIFPTTGQPRGKPANDLAPSNLVYCIQNHDQVGNRPTGDRLGHQIGLSKQAAAAMILLFLPTLPLIFMGEEWGASSPFLYFTDHETTLGQKITEGRRAEFSHFQAFANPDLQRQIPDPQSEATFRSSILKWEERSQSEHQALLNVYRRMLSLRAKDPVLAKPSSRMTCEVVGSCVIVRRSEGAMNRVLIFNAGQVDAPSPLSFDDASVLLSSTSITDNLIPAHGAILICSTS